MSPGKRDSCRVNVYVRSRPLPVDDPNGISSLLFPDSSKVIIQDARHDTIYKFDHVFPLDTTNAEVCKVVSEPLVSALFSGNNGSFLVYGQTGAGKTHTVLYNGGVIPTTIEHIFAITKNSDPLKYKVYLSYIQIYQERIYDLLLEHSGPLNLREHPREGIIVEGLSEEEVTCEEEAKKLIETGQKKLIVTHTKASPFSSRSHAVCIFKVCKRFSYSDILPDVSMQEREKRPISPDQYECGKLNIYSFHEGAVKVSGSTSRCCDLAGTERSTKLRTASGRRLDESRHINTSLLELGNVIHALALKNNPYIPFRNSCLTRILQDSLGGNSKASLMICVSASVEDIKETKCSLNFGQRAMKVMKETIANTQPQVDPQWLTNSGKRKRLKKTDYKILSKYLTSKLKELELMIAEDLEITEDHTNLELAYKLEKENLDALKRTKERENPEGDEEILSSSPLLLKRSLGVLTEELAQLEDGNHYNASAVDSGINTDELDSPPPLRNTKSVSSSTQYFSSDFDSSEAKENIPVHEIMSQALLVERIFRPEDTLPFQLANTNLSRHSVGTETDDMVNFSMKANMDFNSEMNQHNMNTLTSTENLICTENKRNSLNKSNMISEGTSTRDSVIFNGDLPINGSNSSHYEKTDQESFMAKQEANHKVVQTTNQAHESGNIMSHEKTFNNASTQFEIFPGKDENKNTKEKSSSESTPIITSIELLPNSEGTNLADYHFERIVDKNAEYTTTDISIIDSNVCLDHPDVGNVKQTLLHCNNRADEKIFEEMQTSIDDVIEQKNELNSNDNENSNGLLREIDHTLDKNSKSNSIETEIVEIEHPVQNMTEISHDTIKASNDAHGTEISVTKPYINEAKNEDVTSDVHNDKDIANKLPASINGDNSSSDEKHLDQLRAQINGDDNNSNEKYVDQLHSYLLENIDKNSGVTDSIDGSKKKISNCKREINFDNVPPKEGVSNIMEVNAVEITNPDKNDIVEIKTNGGNCNVAKNVRSIESDYVIENDNTLINEKTLVSTDVTLTNEKPLTEKREICVQTDKICPVSSSSPAITEQNLKEYLPPESDEEERERFMNRFCYSASQHLQTGDSDFEYKEAKYMMSNPAEDELYQGCLVYLTDTESVSDYSEMSEDSVFSDFNQQKSSDSEFDETIHAKLLMENIKNKYEMLLSDFDHVASERSRLQGDTRKRSCYDLLSNFKTALEEELLKLDGHHSGRSSASDSTDSRACFSPLHSSDLQKHLSLDILSPAKTKNSLVPFGRTSPDGAQQKTPSKHHKLKESLDENNNQNRNDRNNENNNNNQTKLKVLSTDDIRTKLRPSEKCDNELTLNKPQASPKFDPFRASPIHSTPNAHRSSRSLDGTPDTLAAYGNIHSPIYNRSLSLQDRRNDDLFGSRFGGPTTEHEKLKRELMLTKLEKSRLEAVLSCVLLTNDIDLPNESNLKNLTLSRSTLSSSTSMAQLQKLSRSSSPFQNIQYPMRSYSYKERRFATPESLPALSNLAQTVNSRQRSRARSIPESTDGVDKWLNQDTCKSVSELSQDGSTLSPCSSFAEITSMSDIETPGSSVQDLSPFNGEGRRKLLEDLSLDKDLNEEDLDALLDHLQKKDKSPLACVPFIKRRSIRKKLKKAKKLCDSQSSGIS